MDNKEIRKLNLKYAVSVFGSIAALAEKSGCSQKYISQILNGFQGDKDRSPRGLGNANAAKIANAINQPIYWMDQPHPDLWDGAEIPHASIIQAIVELPQRYSLQSTKKIAIDESHIPDDAFAVKIEDDSMSPEFDIDDVVIIDPSKNPRPGSVVCAKQNDKYVFGRYRSNGLNDKGQIDFDLLPKNQYYPQIKSTDIEVIGNVIEIRKKLKL